MKKIKYKYKQFEFYYVPYIIRAQYVQKYRYYGAISLLKIQVVIIYRQHMFGALKSNIVEKFVKIGWFFISLLIS